MTKKSLRPFISNNMLGKNKVVGMICQEKRFKMVWKILYRNL